ncbi:4-amino-4-deoxy-L-arabinose transferase and related glycosyltransferases of PMT family [Variovorax sp. HW608]|uniref:ArnT family glycosyltransferase n=1 Tax=Variovorax sp. HW608 TaxID=1034889 RepID=UPI00081FDE90|nr:glycosyltransferase family 39 protein [Variovorax sp. HW608]SCK07854.1 4-amino-4-deoxy-L-arabinose transferase and related glycosyltransferases of PMT family [Variovorax sp. HW608]
MIIFAAAHYAALAVFVASCWGLGRAVLARFGTPVRSDVWLEAAMAVTTGLGIFICLFQAFGIAGRFTPTVVVTMVALGVAVAIAQLPAWLRQLRMREVPPALSWLEKMGMIALALVAVTTLAAPLAPPAAFDELMYHLPYAREVAGSGRLGVYEWLRYPWFPYNYNLLYAGALMVGNDVFPHLINALAGWTSVLIVYRLGVLHVNRVVACVGAAIWLAMGDYTGALIDTSVALFVLAACAALWWWREAPPPHGSRWLALAAFFLGIAAGSKYQALTVLPLVGVFVLWHERRPRVLALALLCFLIPCVYWYARNAIMTGDPFNPIGARVFGFTNWNAADYRLQLQDVRDHAALPSPLIWALLAVPFSAHWKRSAALRAAAVFCLYSLFVWSLTSRYPRYLTSAFPLFALTAAVGWQTVFGGIAARLRRKMPEHDRSGGLDRAGRWFAILLLAAGVGLVFHKTREKVSMIAVTPQQREAFLRKNVPGYAVMNYLREHATGHVYQIALSEATYYGPSPVWGDTIGPWRYSDFILFPPADYARKLAEKGFEAIAVSLPTATYLEAQPGFHEQFALMYEKDNAKAYRIRQYRNDRTP